MYQPGNPLSPEPGNRRLLVIIQADVFNQSRIRAVIGATLTTNLMKQVEGGLELEV